MKIKKEKGSSLKTKKIVSLVILILWCLVIFFFSNQNGIDSSKSSSFVVGIVKIYLLLL